MLRSTVVRFILPVSRDVSGLGYVMAELVVIRLFGFVFLFFLIFGWKIMRFPIFFLTSFDFCSSYSSSCFHRKKKSVTVFLFALLLPVFVCCCLSYTNTSIKAIDIRVTSLDLHFASLMTDYITDVTNFNMLAFVILLPLQLFCTLIAAFVFVWRFWSPCRATLHCLPSCVRQWLCPAADDPWV